MQCTAWNRLVYCPRGSFTSFVFSLNVLFFYFGSCLPHPAHLPLPKSFASLPFFSYPHSLLSYSRYFTVSLTTSPLFSINCNSSSFILACGKHEHFAQNVFSTPPFCASRSSVDSFNKQIYILFCLLFLVLDAHSSKKQTLACLLKGDEELSLSLFILLIHFPLEMAVSWALTRAVYWKDERKLCIYKWRKIVWWEGEREREREREIKE